MEQGVRETTGLWRLGGAQGGGEESQHHHRGLQQGLEEVPGLHQQRDPLLLPQPEAGHVPAPAVSHLPGPVLSQIQPHPLRGATVTDTRHLATYQHPSTDGRGQEI